VYETIEGHQVFKDDMSDFGFHAFAACCCPVHARQRKVAVRA